ncbi:putative diguanylate cyclase AdrA [Novipirellula aureliae]|uniref:diguanylate cyclase n=1 Tax=Novipirellula aureliae TaxID=2527966 RepID=A0A5C6DWN6_9BACT|nr:GGDEF domain-containing protein [Novipirellula aureliae]TWU40307.1 putative diguanylate cyclase AdrA [Novipirellula aureliae]
MFLDLAVALSCAGIGLCCGWVAHGIGWLESSDQLSVAQSSQIQLELTRARAEQERLAIVAERLKDNAVRMAIDVDDHQGNIQAVTDSLSSDEVASTDAVMEAVNRLIATNEKMQSKLQSAKKQIHDQAEQLESAERRAQTDALTSISNRGAFDEHLKRRHALGMDRAGTLVLLDIDHFKPFNDKYGHRCGDEVLKVVAQMFHARLKSYGIVARFGGEEFAVIIDGYTVEECESIVESARVAISQQVIDYEGNDLQVTASMGVAQPLEEDTVAQWIERADAALYHAKKHGRNCGYMMDNITPRLISLSPEEASKSRPLPKPRRRTKSESDAEAATGETQEMENDARSELIEKDDSDAPQAIDTAGRDEPANVDTTSEQPSPTGTMEGAPEGYGTITYGPAEEQSPADVHARLPALETLEKEFDELQARSKALKKKTQMISLHVTGRPATGSIRALLQVVRASLRSVDRIVAQDAATFIVCIPNSDPQMMQERAEQIRTSAESIRFGDQRDEHAESLEMKYIELESYESFERAMERLEQVGPFAAVGA